MTASTQSVALSVKNVYVAHYALRNAVTERDARPVIRLKKSKDIIPVLMEKFVQVVGKKVATVDKTHRQKICFGGFSVFLHSSN